MTTPTSNQFEQVVCADLTATIANGETTSEEVDLKGAQLSGLIVPAEFNGTTITFQAASESGGTFYTIQNGAAEAAAYTITTTASRFVPIDNLAIFAGVRHLKVVCGTAQTGATTIQLITRPV